MSPLDGGCTAFRMLRIRRYSVVGTRYPAQHDCFRAHLLVPYRILSTEYRLLLDQDRAPDEAHWAHSPGVYKTQRG